MSGRLIVVETWFVVWRFFQITFNWICKNTPLKNVTVCTWTVSEELFTRPKSHKIYPKEKRKIEGREKRQSEKTSVPYVFIPSTLEIVSEREKSRNASKGGKWAGFLQASFRKPS